MAMKKSTGFTLIELMIALAVAAILMAIAVPAFTSQLRKSRRADAVQALSDLQLKEERWRSNHTTYDTIANIGGAATSLNGYYAITYATPTSTGGSCTCSAATCYALTAGAQNAQAADTACASMVLTNTCGTISKTPTSGRCWN